MLPVLPALTYPALAQHRPISALLAEIAASHGPVSLPNLAGPAAAARGSAQRARVQKELWAPGHSSPQSLKTCSAGCNLRPRSLHADLSALNQQGSQNLELSRETRNWNLETPNQEPRTQSRDCRCLSSSDRVHRLRNKTRVPSLHMHLPAGSVMSRSYTTTTSLHAHGYACSMRRPMR